MTPELKELIQLQFQQLRREVQGVDQQVEKGLEELADQDSRLRELEIRVVRLEERGRHNSNDNSNNDRKLSIRAIGGLISGAIGGLWLIYEAIKGSK